MYNVETLESLQSYGRRLQSERAHVSAARSARRGTVRSLVRRVRRSA
ncbi:MAG: hypothetical protein JJD92_13160 [Frankiaceae bacterium]|nr:hypothetical protein [Frankiaceae bacterium]